MNEFAPGGTHARMTKSQVRKYIRDMKAAQELAKQKLIEAQNSGELEKETQRLKELEEELDEL